MGPRVTDDREKDGSPRTRKSSPTLAAFRPWGSSARYRRTGNLRRVYETAAWRSDRGRRTGGFRPAERSAYPLARRIRLVAYGARLESGLG